MNGAWIPCYLALVIGLGIGFWLHSLLDTPVQAPPLPDAPLPMPGYGAAYDADLRAESTELEVYEKWLHLRGHVDVTDAHETGLYWKRTRRSRRNCGSDKLRKY